MTSLNELIGAAKKEDWNKVDAILPEVCNDSSFIEWALKNGLKDSDGNIRDLAASILEKTQKITKDMKDRLYQVMKQDSHPYAKFRAAFAIAAHDLQYHPDEVKEVLEIAKKDKDISDIAYRYSEKYEKRHNN